MNNEYEKIKSLVGEGKTPEASKILLEKVKGDPELEKIILLNSGTYNNIFKEKLAGTVENNYVQMNTNQFGAVVLELNELVNKKIEQDLKNPANVVNTTITQNQPNQILMNILIVLGILILLSILGIIIWKFGEGLMYLAAILVVLIVIAIILKNIEENT